MQKTAVRKGKVYLIIKRKGHFRAMHYRNGKLINAVFVAPTTYLKRIK